MPVFDKIKRMNNGWFIGNFLPCVFHSDQVEVAHHFYPKGFKGTPHTHKIATEINYVVKGSAIVSGTKVKKGDIFIYDPNERSEVEFLKDTDLIIVKVPSVVGDKYNL